MQQDRRAAGGWRRAMVGWACLPGMLAAAAVHAQDGAPTLAEGMALARDRTCLACHQVDKRRVGPSFLVVAERFAGQPAVDYLAQAIREGGRGRWGAVPMPAQPHVSEADARRLALWILSLAPSSTSSTEGQQP